MARLTVSKTAERRKRIVVALSVFLEMYTAVSALVLLMASKASLNSLGENDFSFTPAQTSSARGVSSTKRKRRSIDTCEPITADSLLRAAIMLSEKLESVGEKISRSLGAELNLQEKIEQLDSKLSQIEGLSYDDKFMTLIKLPEYPNQVLVFFSLAPDRRPEWVKRFLATH